MKKILVILCLLLSNVFIHCQNITFSKTYDNFFLADSKNIINYKNGYLILGGDNLIENEILHTRIAILYMNNNGDAIWAKNYGELNVDYYHGTGNSLKINKNGGYSLAGSKYYKETSKSGSLLVKFDENFDTLWTKTYFNTSYFNAFYNHIETSTGEFVMVGRSSERDSDGDILVVKTDKDGNMIWYDTYGSYKSDIAVAIVETYDGGYLIGGGRDRDNYIFKINKDGDVEWEDNYGHPEYINGGIGQIIQTKDSGYIATAAETIHEFSFYKYGKGSIRKYDKDLNLQWYKLYGRTGLSTALSSLTETENGDIAVIKLDGSLIESSLLFLNSNGDSIRQVNYDTPEFFEEFMLFSIAQTPDNGFIMTGFAFSQYRNQEILVIKTDECGCVEEDCDCNLSICPNTGINNNDIEIYPNPAVDYLYIKYDFKYGNKKETAEIYDLTGRCMLTYPINSNVQTINVSSLKSGLYILKIGNYSKQIIISK